MAPTKQKYAELQERMQKLGIEAQELVEKFILGSGRGGQKVNKTSSCVYLKHAPTGIEVKCQKARSRELNRYYARKELCEKLEGLIFQEKSRQKQLIAKIRRQKKRRSKRAQEKVLAAKKRRSQIKQLRGLPED